MKPDNNSIITTTDKVIINMNDHTQPKSPINNMDGLSPLSSLVFLMRLDIEIPSMLDDYSYLTVLKQLAYKSRLSHGVR